VVLMSKNDSDAMTGQGDNSQDDPDRISLWGILRRLNAGQALTVFGSMIGLFGGGYSIGQWVSDLRHHQKIEALLETHRAAIRDKDAVITARDSTIQNLGTGLAETQRLNENINRDVEEARETTRLFRIKTEFLNRFYQYQKDSSPDGDMRRLFVYHVCDLWRITQLNNSNPQLNEASIVVKDPGITTVTFFDGTTYATYEVPPLVASGVHLDCRTAAPSAPAR
jgi:hypothetical protein